MYACTVSGAHAAVVGDENEQPPIFAAGGILQRPGATGPEIVTIYRPRYKDWSLPKGKLKVGEAWEAAALREVHEETGNRATITSFAGPIIYHVAGRLKIVLFWNMRADGAARFRPSKEVEAAEWLSVGVACERLTYEAERRLLADLFPGQS
jgi:8-oxo-dGTP diphosphatase